MRIITGLLVLLAAANGALAQIQTLSARPGLVNYVEGEATLNGQPLYPMLKMPVSSSMPATRFQPQPAKRRFC